LIRSPPMTPGIRDVTVTREAMIASEALNQRLGGFFYCPARCAMDVWILSECNAVTASLRKAFIRVGVECPPERIVDAASSYSAEMRGGLVFYAVPQFSAQQSSRLRAVESKLCECELVVVAPMLSGDAVLSAVRCGATDYLNSETELEADLADLLARIRLRRGMKSHVGRLLSIVPCHSPCDGNVLAVNMAAVVAQSAQSCLLIDFHLRGGDISLLLQTTPKYTIYDLLKYHSTFDDAMFQQALTSHSSGLRLLAGPPMFSDLQGIAPDFTQHLLAIGQASYPFVFVSCEDVVHAEQMQAVESSDDVLVLMRLDLATAHRAKQHYDYIVRNGVSPERIHLVALGTGVRGELPISSVKELIGVPKVHCIPDDPAAVTASINVGNPLVLELPKSSTARAIKALTYSLTQTSRDTSTIERARSFLRRAAAALTVNTLVLGSSTLPVE